MSFQTRCPLGGNPFFSEDLALSLYGYLYNTCSMISHTIWGTQHSCVIHVWLVTSGLQSSAKILVLTPSGLNKLPEVHFEFPLNLTGK